MNYRMLRSFLRNSWGILLLIFFLSGPTYGAQKEKEAEKKEDKQEKQLQSIGQEIEQQVDAEAQKLLQNLYPDDFLQGYVTELGQSLVPPETPADILFSFRVISDPSPNALALPDGRIFINSGLLTFVENEAQLATILGHEIGHVLERHVLEAIKESRSVKRGLLGGLVGGVAGGLVGGLTGSDKAGAQVAAQAQQTFLAAAANSYGRKQEDEADLVGVRLALNQRFDPTQGISFFQKITARFGQSSRFVNWLSENHSLNSERAKNIQRVLDDQLKDEYNKRKTAGELTLGSGQLRFHASAMIRDTAIALAESYDQYDTALQLLESIRDVRGRDPKTLWYLGRIYRMTARTEEQKNKALELLQEAAKADERDLYPGIHKDLGLMLATRSNNLPAAVDSLKKYVVGSTTRYNRYPQDMEQIYDYLLLFGDSNWTAPRPAQAIIQPMESGESQSRGAPPAERGPR